MGINPLYLKMFFSSPIFSWIGLLGRNCFLRFCYVENNLDDIFVSPDISDFTCPANVTNCEKWEQEVDHTLDYLNISGAYRVHINISLILSNWMEVLLTASIVFSLARSTTSAQDEYCHTWPGGKTYPIPKGSKDGPKSGIIFNSQPASQPTS